MALHAVVFDYGLVLSGPQEPEAYAQLLRITGLPKEQFENFYWADRHAYDLGELTGIGFWQKLMREAGLSQDQAKAEELNHWDARMWTTVNPVTLAWQRALKQRGLLTAILSNIGDAVLASVEREFNWIHGFDVLVWSYQLGIAKPDPAIYRHVLAKLGTRPEETLFLDDKTVNIEAARALGIHAIEFSTVENLRAEIIKFKLESELPLLDL